MEPLISIAFFPFALCVMHDLGLYYLSYYTKVPIHYQDSKFFILPLLSPKLFVILTKETLSFIIAPNMMNFAQTHQFPTEQTSNWASYCSLSLLQTYSANSNALQNNEMFIERLSTQYSRISYHDKNHRKHIIFGNSSIFEWNTVTQL